MNCAGKERRGEERRGDLMREEKGKVLSIFGILALLLRLPLLRRMGVDVDVDVGMGMGMGDKGTSS
jgi:hypothetical protein